MGNETTVVVIGGGIAGTSCIEALFQDYDQTNPHYSCIVLISDSKLVKRVQNYESSGRQLERFDVYEGDIEELSSSVPHGLNFKSIIGSVRCINSSEKTLVYRHVGDKGSSCDSTLSFDILCICNGSKPRHLSYTKEVDTTEVNKRVIVIRDTNSVSELRMKLFDCRRLVIVGNGGISLELVSKISNCKKVWIIRDKSIGYTFFDSGAGKFLLGAATHDNHLAAINKRSQISYSASPSGDWSETESHFGPALGPNWSQGVELSGKCVTSQGLNIVYQDEVADIVYIGNQEHPLRIITRNGKEIDCDLVALAIGVTPNNLEIIGGHLETSSSDGGITVDEQMRSSLNQIYAAGDVVSCEKWAHNELWFQMRLWTQARQMGYYSGRCISAHIRKQDPSIYFNFECFTHCTCFFGYKLVLLGRYNGQTVAGGDCGKLEVIARVNPDKDYVKILISDGRIIGAVLVGDSGLEETIENLIHDRIDVSSYKEQLLDNTIDIEDYFD